MERSRVLAELAGELGLIEPSDVPILLQGFKNATSHSNSADIQLTFEQWAVATGVLTARDIVKLMEVFNATLFQCGACSSTASGVTLRRDEELACPACGMSALSRGNEHTGPMSLDMASDDVPPPTADPNALSRPGNYDWRQLDTPQSGMQNSGTGSSPGGYAQQGGGRAAAPVAAAPVQPQAAGASAELTSEILDKGLKPGMQIGGNRIIRELGRGGMGIVYLAVQVDLDRPVVIKVLSNEFKTDSPQMLRFRREARAIARLHHENVVSVHHLGESAGRPYLVMEFVDGESAYEYLRRIGKTPVKDALRIGFGTAKGLQAAHLAGIVHRDVKPGNILLGKDGSVKLVDFGLAKEVEEDPSVPKLSRSGYIIGTPWYLAPEQVEGLEVTGAADVYALGISLYHLIVGELPFSGPMVQVVMHQLNTPLPKIRSKVPECPPAVEQFIERMCAKPTEDRFSMQETIDGLGALLHAQTAAPTAVPTAHAQPAERDPRAPTGSRSRAAARAASRTAPKPSAPAAETNKVSVVLVTIAALAVIIAVVAVMFALLSGPRAGANSGAGENGAAQPNMVDDNGDAGDSNANTETVGNDPNAS